MKKLLFRPCLVALLCGTFVLPTQAQDVESRLYGKITTRHGETFEGLIRWDKNEVSWVDILDGSKRTTRTDSDRRKRRSVRVLGYEFNFDDDGNHTRTRTSGLRFGNVSRLENAGRDKALLVLRNGDEIEFRGGSTDIGTDVREIVIEDSRRGEIELEWRDIDVVEFMQAPRGTRDSRYGRRLFGTLTTRDGATYTGMICWDIDEVLEEDELDGTDDEGYKRKIRFGDIVAMERYSRRSTEVELRSGERVVLRGTNDVNNENRGILVLDPSLGQVRVDWDGFDRVEFVRPTQAVDYNAFSTQGRIRGTVTDRDGRSYTGTIRWDDDEAYTWELLNGEQDDLEFEIEFGLVSEIERISSRRARVTLRDGRILELRGSNDVNDDNDGIIIETEDGELVFLDWYDFERAVFDKP